MEKKVLVHCLNNDMTKSYPVGTSLIDIYEDICPQQVGAVVAKVNGKVRDLKFCVYKPKQVEFLGLDTQQGQRAYLRSLSFLLFDTIYSINSSAQLRIEHPISGGYLCEISGLGEVTQSLCDSLKEKMMATVKRNIDFEQEIVPTEDAIKYFSDLDLKDKVNILRSKGEIYTELYRLGGLRDFFYGCLVPSTGYLDKFCLTPYHGSVLLSMPSINDTSKVIVGDDQPKLFNAFKEHTEFNALLGVKNVGDLNLSILENKNSASNLIKIAEALQEKKIAKIADEIAKREKARIVLLAGPSSSGKTTSSKRLSVQLAVCGLKPIAVSLDDYFVPRSETPRDEKGNYDFESLYALDLELFNNDLNKLLAGEEVELPRYNFETGLREYNGNRVKLTEGCVLIFEGIHALNPLLTAKIPAENKFKIFVSALTSISLDDHNCIPTTDNRLIRRIVRDYKYRGYSAEDTIMRWPDVMRGEEKWIVPFQEEADAMFNSAMIFELGVLKQHALAPLNLVPQSSPAYMEAVRLLKFLGYFAAIPESEIPQTSLLREFVGGSSFKY